MLIYVDDIDAQATTNSSSLTAQPFPGSLLISAPNSATATTLALEELRCDGDPTAADIEISAFDASGAYVQHAKVILDQAEPDIWIGEGADTDNKTNHGVVLDDRAAEPGCDSVLRKWNLHIAAHASIDAIGFLAVDHDSSADNKTDHGVVLIEE